MNKVEQLLGLGPKKEFMFSPGDTVKVHTKVVEGDTERIQIFDGLIMAVRGSGAGRTFTVRKMSYGVGVERVFPVNSPRIEKIELVKSGKVRRAKLNYIRELSGKASRLHQKEEFEGAQHNQMASTQPSQEKKTDVPA